VTLAAEPLRRRLRRSLGERTEALDAVLAAAARSHAEILLVGGPVRDLLLGRPILDLDLLVSSRLEDVARLTARALGAKVVVRSRFLTATVEADALRIDLARAREERYPRPGALPVVRAAEVAEDLARRDFTVHALALPLDPRSGSRLLDPHGGVADLRRRELRVLHPRSFEDDPTRLLRAARYASRLDFELAPGTARLACEGLAAGVLDRVTGDRLRAELLKLLGEPSPGAALRCLAALGLSEPLVRGWRPGRSALRALDRLGRCAARAPWPRAASPSVRAAAGLRLFLLGARPRVARVFVERFALTGAPAHELLEDLARLPRLAAALERELAPGALDALLGRVREPLLLAAHCALPAASARAITRYARTLRSRASPFDGHQARAFGARGPVIGKLLRAARRRALDGRPVNESWARRFVARAQRIG
jgi:tRNA nucleotidyltransferase (CCA-adding enzyme)